jgi:hypothetical protein
MQESGAIYQKIETQGRPVADATCPLRHRRAPSPYQEAQAMIAPAPVIPASADAAADATRALDIAERDLLSARYALQLLLEAGTPTNDPFVIGTKLRIAMAAHVATEARAWRNEIGH